MESSLADNYRDIIGSVGFDMGWGRGVAFGEREWDARKTTTLTQCVKGGLQQFYHPPPDQSGVSYQWSFLKPRARLTFPSGESTVRLPFDFKGLEGTVTVIPGTSGNGFTLKTTRGVRARYAMYSTTTGQPRCLEIEPLKEVNADHGQRFQFVIWPTADADYTLEFNYSILGKMLTGDLPYAYGGAEHSSTIKASCLAWAELHLDDIPNGPKQQYWRERLAASISMDRQKQPHSLGYNADRSDRREVQRTSRWSHGWGFVPITVNGEIPS